MSLDLSLSEEQQALARGVARFCRERAQGGFAPALWRGLGELGVLGLATPEGGGGAMEVLAAMEPLGQANCAGPFFGTLVATQLLPVRERELASAGEIVVALGVPPLMPWAPLARLFVELAHGRAFLARPRGPVEPLETLAEEPWGRVVMLEREADLGPAAPGLALADVGLAAYLAAAGRRLTDIASDHARTRKQFGRPVGAFQAVSQPLADSAMHLAAAATLARTAAYHLDARDASAPALAAAARLCAGRAALTAAYRVAQILGAGGMLADGPVFPVVRRIRQLVSEAESANRGQDLVLSHFGLSEESHGPD